MNLEYGSHAPGAPDVFIGDAQLAAYWRTSDRHYLTAHGSALSRLKPLLGIQSLHVVWAAGGKYLFTNHPLPATRFLIEMETGSVSQASP
jgi:hypothetical protein